MVDVSKLNYRLLILSPSGKHYDLKDYIENLEWEENEKELATRITFSLYNEKTKANSIGTKLKLGTLVAVFAKDGSEEKEVARGFVTEWKPTKSNSESIIQCTCYDELYNLQQSEDNVYYSSGTNTKTAITQLCKKWSIPLGEYKGSNIKHGKQKFESERISDIILELLNDAHKKGGDKCILRAYKGKVQVIPVESNQDIYCFLSDNTKSVSHKMSTANMVTRVKILGQEEKKKKAKVEATVDGNTKFGIRQKIYRREKDKSLAEAKKAAEKILKEDGTVEETVQLQAPDVPFLRKGDLIYVKVGTLNGYYQILGVQHSASDSTMSMDLKKSSGRSNGRKKKGKEGTYQIGDIVEFKGGTQYVSSYKEAKGYSAKAGKAKITKINGSGKAHPWHLIHIDGKSNVYGWVDDGTFE